MKKLKTIWSGGQIGIDIAALAAARDSNLETGGWIPKGFITRYGAKPELAKLGLREHSSPKYSPRTYANVKDTDGTIILAIDFNSSGTRCTKKAIDFYSKPFYEVNLNDPDFIFDVIDWINDNEIITLNVAGNGGKNREESSWLFTNGKKYLSNVFRAFKEEKEKI
jgi:hypothetical protein